MGENAVRGTFGSYYQYPITHAQKIETLKEFFRVDRTFKFRKQPGAPNVFTLFLDFAPHVEEDTKEAFLRNV